MLRLFPISNKFIVLVFIVHVVVGVEILYGQYFLKAIYFPQFVYILKSSFISHGISNIK